MIEHGFNFTFFCRQIIESPLAAFAWLDVVVTVIVTVLMVVNEGKKLRIKRLWIPIVASFIGGAAVGLPLYLYMKQCHIDNNDSRRS